MDEKPDDETRATVRSFYARVAVISGGLAVIALFFNVGETYDSQCGSLLNQGYYGWTGECTTPFRVAAGIVVIGALFAIGFGLAAWRSRTRRRWPG